MNLRLAQQFDVAILNELMAASITRLGEGYYSPQQIQSAIKHVFGVDTQLVRDATYYVVEGIGGIAGCGGWSKRKTLYGGDQMKESIDPLLDPAKDPARLRAFFVRPDCARRGVATVILDACLQAAAEAGFSNVELVATLPGEPFYSRAGFVVTERLPTILPDGVAIEFVRMHRSLVHWREGSTRCPRGT